MLQEPAVRPVNLVGHLRRFALVALVSLALIVPLQALPAQAALTGVTGSGTSSDPYQVETADGLYAIIGEINADPGGYGAANIEVTADLDLAGRDPLPMIDTFTGSIDGMGHTISNLSYAAGTGGHRGMIRQLTGGRVSNLRLSNLAVDNGTSTGFVAGIAVYATNATLSGNSVVKANLKAASAEKVAGLVAESDGCTITDNYVDATIIANEMPAGIASYAKNASTLSRNLVRADLTMLTGGGVNGTKGNDAGMILGYPGNPNTGVFSGNVALGGTIAYDGKIDGFVGRILGYTGYSGWTATDNLANTDITISGSPVTGPGVLNQHGTDTAAATLAQQATYEALGWDFGTNWAFDTDLGHPVPKYTYSLRGSGTADSPYEITSEFDLEFLAQRLNAGDGAYTAATNIELTSDLDFTGRDPFEGINTFTGTLDGMGHTIANLTYGPSAASARLGFIRALNKGTVRNLTLDAVTAVSTSTTESDFVAGLAVVATDATVDKVSLIGMHLDGAGVEKVSGIAAELRGASSVTNCWVDGSAKAKKMPGGIAGYAHNTSVIKHNLASMDLTVVNSNNTGTRGIDAGAIVSYPGSGNAVTIDGNVSLDGSITYTGTVTGFVGRILGYYQATGSYAVSVLDKNLANSAITISGTTVSGTATSQNGADTSAAELAKQSTYEGIGWSFETDWTFDKALGHPLPKYVRIGDRPNRITATFTADPSTERSFTWYSDLTSDTATVQVSTAKSLEGATTATATATRGTGLDGENFYKATITGLTPGERYYYRVGDSAMGVWSSIGTFLTSDGHSDFSFVDIADTQAQNLTEAELSAATIAKSLSAVPAAQFLMQNGDLVEHGGSESDWENLLTSAQDSLLSTTIAPAAGNHDAPTDGFIDHFAVPAPNGQSTTTGAYYSFTYNKAHFVVLNTNDSASQNLSADQLSWLREDVTQARKDGAGWVIVNIHKGPFATGNHADDADIIAMRQELLPVMAEVGIDLVLEGHDHVISRSKPLTYDASGVASVKTVKTQTFTEMVNGKRVEYAVKPDGTIFFLPNTGGAKHYTQKSSSSALDLESYLQLFDRTGEQATENFAAVRVSKNRLTVDVYDIRDQGQPRLFESFGIDRQVSDVDDQIAALPAVDELTAADAAAVAKVRTSVDQLTSAQRGALHNQDALQAREAKLRKLSGAVVTDGSQWAWAATDASTRTSVTIRNDTRTVITDQPVRVTLTDTPQVAADQLAFFAQDGTALPYEVESWNQGGNSVVWVRVPSLAAQSATTVWAYFGTDQGKNAAAQVWADDYSLVEHFAKNSANGTSFTDSTGKATASVVGADWNTALADGGDGAAALGAARLQYSGDIGGGYDRIAISSVVSLTAAQLGAMTGNAPIVAKESQTSDGQVTFWQGIKSSGKLAVRLAGNSFEFGNVDLNNEFDFPADGKPHLITQTYDGMTYSVFLDGAEVLSQMVEYRSTYSDPKVLTTIGDSYTNDGTLASPFRGIAYEVEVAGKAFSPDLEAFRYANYFGDAVRVGALTAKADQNLELVVDDPDGGSQVEAGLVTVTGTLGARAQLTATVAGDQVFGQSVDAGHFSIKVPVNALGDQELLLQASAAGKTSEARVPLTVVDTKAPAQPAVSDTSDEATAAHTDVALSATPVTDDQESVQTTFYANTSIALNEDNTVVRAGTSSARTPDALTPDSGEVTTELHPTTVGDNKNPYQLYSISLTDDQAAQDQFHLTWSGKVDKRRVSALVWNTETSSWQVVATGSSSTGGTVNLDVTATVAENHPVSADHKLTVLIWRGLTSVPFARSDYSAQPDSADFDWGMAHIPDSQLYSQATPDLLTDQLQYVSDTAAERKTELVVQAGDWVNRPYLSQEYQWKNSEPAMKTLEAAKIPAMISWGNHDYELNRNNSVMMPKYYPMSRFADDLAGSPWTFGGSNGIDNYYYYGTIGGAKILVLTVGFFSADNSGDEGLAWAAQVIKDHPAYNVIIANHNCVNTGANNWSNSNITSKLVDPFDNVKLVLGGHITGTGVAARSHGNTTTYGILTDYQGRVYGGQEYFKQLSIDVENGLLYANTYSPLLNKTTSEGAWHQSISESAVSGFHGSDSENFVLELDLDANTTRTLETGSLTLAAGAPTQIGEVQSTRGAQSAGVVFTSVQPDTSYQWYAELTDQAGHTTRSTTSTFTIASPQVVAPSAPQQVQASASGDTITVTWTAPAVDGGAPVSAYEVALSDGIHSATVTNGLTAALTGVAPGHYTASVRAQNSAGWSPWSAPSTGVEVAGASPSPTITPSPTTTPTTGTKQAVLDLPSTVVGGQRFLAKAYNLVPGATYTVRLGSATVSTIVASPGGSGRQWASVSRRVKPGRYTLRLMKGSTQSATAKVRVMQSPKVSVKPSSTIITLGQRGSAKITVSAAGTVTGKVVVRMGSFHKTLRLQKGATRVVLPTFGHTGTYKLSVTYTGTANYQRHTVTKTLRVKR